MRPLKFCGFVSLALILGTFSLFCLMSSCSSPAAAEKEPYEISGTVIDADTEKPIAEADMTLLGVGVLQRKTTNTDGRYLFIHHGSCIDDGGDVTGLRAVRIEAKKTGYKSKITWIRCSPRVHTIDFKLEPGFDPPNRMK